MNKYYNSVFATILVSTTQDDLDNVAEDAAKLFRQNKISYKEFNSLIDLITRTRYEIVNGFVYI